MKLSVRSCPIDRRPLHQRAASAATAPLRRYLSEQAANPRGIGGRLLGRLWVTETATVNDAAIEVLAPTSGEHVLEIGFGPGRALGLIGARGAIATGIEVSTAMAAKAAHRNAAMLRSGALTLRVGDGVTLPVDDESVDAVLAVHNLYFWAQPQATLGEIARILRPGGRVLLVFRGREHPLPGRLDPAIYRTVTTEDAVTWLRDAGFTDVERRSPAGVPAEMSFLLGTLQR
jgi:SAM-dependent methyltransferase